MFPEYIELCAAESLHSAAALNLQAQTSFPRSSVGMHNMYHL